MLFRNSVYIYHIHITFFVFQYINKFIYYIIIQTVTLSGGSNKLLQGTTVLTTDSGEKLVMDGEKVIGKLKLLPSSDRSNSSSSGKVSDTTFWVLLDLFSYLYFSCLYFSVLDLKLKMK